MKSLIVLIALSSISVFSKSPLMENMEGYREVVRIHTDRYFFSFYNDQPSYEEVLDSLIEGEDIVFSEEEILSNSDCGQVRSIYKDIINQRNLTDHKNERIETESAHEFHFMINIHSKELRCAVHVYGASEPETIQCYREIK